MINKKEKLRRRDCYEAILNRSFWTGRFSFEGHIYKYREMKLYILRHNRWQLIEEVIGIERLVGFISVYHELYKEGE